MRLFPPVDYQTFVLVDLFSTTPIYFLLFFFRSSAVLSGPKPTTMANWLLNHYRNILTWYSGNLDHFWSSHHQDAVLRRICVNDNGHSNSDVEIKWVPVSSPELCFFCSYTTPFFRILCSFFLFFPPLHLLSLFLLLPLLLLLLFLFFFFHPYFLFSRNFFLIFVFVLFASSHF